jgi:hypothetical protein
VAYELQVARNNWRFLRLYGTWLRRNGYARGRLHEQATFLVHRWAGLIRGRLRSARRAWT